MRRKIYEMTTIFAAAALAMSGCGASSAVEDDTGVQLQEAVVPAAQYEEGEMVVGEVVFITAVTLVMDTEDEGEVAVTLTADTAYEKVVSFEREDTQSPDENGGMPDVNSGTLDGSAEAEVPEKPDDGDNVSDGDGEATQLPEKLDGDDSEPAEIGGDIGDSGARADGGSTQDGGGIVLEGDFYEEISWSDIAPGDTVTVSFGADGSAATVTVGDISDMNMGMNDMGTGGGGGMGGQSSSAPSEYAAVRHYTEDESVSGELISSSGTDENAVLVTDGANVLLEGVAVTRESEEGTGGDDSSFYGVGASLLVTDGVLKMKDCSVNSDAAGGAGVFAYGDGTAYVADTTIITRQGTSGGIHVAGGGTLYAWDVTGTTYGTSSAAVRSDRGGGTMVVNGGTYTSNGTDSPAVYCTADIEICNAALTANASEAVCIEGQNTLRLSDCDLTGSQSADSRNDCIWNVILYQSMSGDSEQGNSTFEMSGGSLTAKEGGIFYTTNTESTITLSGVYITYPVNTDFFLKCTGNANERGWGTAGANGADCLFTALAQEMKGDIIWDSISTLDFYAAEGSTLTGAVLDDEGSVTKTGKGYCNMYIDENSAWIVTGDSTLSALHCSGKITDAQGNAVTVQGTDGTIYVAGMSQYAVTVDSFDAEVPQPQELSDWKDDLPENPF